MKRSLTNLMLIPLSLAIQGSLLSGFVFSQTGEKPESDRPPKVLAKTEERLQAIYEEGAFRARSFQANWHQDGSSYLILETVEGKNARAIVSYDAASGKSRELISASQLVPPGVTEPLDIQNYLFTPDGSRILLQAGSGEDGNGSEGYWMLERKSGALQKVRAGRNNSISPDGQRILFSDQGNLHVYDLSEDRTLTLTKDAVAGSVSNGRAVWSPDGNRIAYVQTDESDVKYRSVLVPGDPTYPEVRKDRYARVGGTIPALRIGVVDAEGKETRWLSIPVPAEGYYLEQVSWAGNSDELLVEKLSRFRDKREFLIADVHNGAIKSIYRESDPAWVIASQYKNAGLEWIRDHNAFLVMSEKDGWRHAYIYSRDGEELDLLTPGESDIIERVMVDKAGGWFYYNASPDNGTQKYLYRVRLDGTSEPERVTPVNQLGTHEYNISPNGKWAFHTYSTFDTPPITELVQLPEHRVVRVLEDNKELRKKMESLIAQPTEFFQLDIGGGVIMDAWMIKPGDFDPSRKYPVFVYVYGEPHAQTVLDAWGRSHADYHRVIADLGYLVVSIDNRGTPAPKGAAWRRAIAGSLGPLSTEEQEAGVLELGRTRPFVDLSRVGIWGWSGGGSNTLNAMFRKPDVYHVGIAVVAKPQPHLYNAWFQEIYMKTPEVNPDGYRESASINFAEGLEGELLIIHGTGETNTHLQIMEGLVDRLIELGKQFDYMTYPNRNHGLRIGKGTQVHLRVQMARYLIRNLPPGPR